jgi:AraC-like DNA-binding protein
MSTSAITSLNFDFVVDSTSAYQQSDLLSLIVTNSPNPLKTQFGLDAPARKFHHRLQTNGSIHVMELEEVGNPSHSSTSFSFEFSRSAAEISHNVNGGHNVCVMLKGHNRFDHCGRQYETSLPVFSFTSNEDIMRSQLSGEIHCLNIALPIGWDRIGDSRIDDLYGLGFQLRDSKRTGLAAYLRRLASRSDALSEPGLNDSLFDVLALELNPRAGSEHSKGLLSLIMQYIRVHFRDPNLSPTEVAAVYNISVRYLHRLFSTHSTTFMKHVTELRLDYAHELLRSPANLGRTVLDIAFFSGFQDINHFGRRFRERFGCTPTEARLGRCPRTPGGVDRSIG